MFRMLDMKLRQKGKRSIIQEGNFQQKTGWYAAIFGALDGVEQEKTHHTEKRKECNVMGTSPRKKTTHNSNPIIKGGGKKNDEPASPSGNKGKPPEH